MPPRTVIVNWPAIRAQLDQALATGDFGNLDLDYLPRADSLRLPNRPAQATTTP